VKKIKNKKELFFFKKHQFYLENKETGRNKIYNLHCFNTKVTNIYKKENINL